MYDQIICFFTISPSYPKICFLCFLFSLICSWLSNKLPPAVVNNLISLLLSMSVIFKSNRAFYLNFDFCFEKDLFPKCFKNHFKIFYKYFFIVTVLCILRISLRVTNPLRKSFLIRKSLFHLFWHCLLLFLTRGNFISN